jgi:hypothetical protein
MVAPSARKGHKQQAAAQQIENSERSSTAVQMLQGLCHMVPSGQAMLAQQQQQQQLQLQQQQHRGWLPTGSGLN